MPADGFNVDHVHLCDRGIYAIETKTWSKPQNRDARIRLTDTGIIVDGHRPDRDPIAQAQAEAKWLARRLKEYTGKSLQVRGVVLIPGWFIEPMTPTWRRSPELPWVLPPNVLRSFIEHEPCRITESDLALALWAAACGMPARDRLLPDTKFAVYSAAGIPLLLLFSGVIFFLRRAFFQGMFGRRNDPI